MRSGHFALYTSQSAPAASAVSVGSFVLFCATLMGRPWVVGYASAVRRSCNWAGRTRGGGRRFQVFG
jgi:hypothetical protein